MFLGVPDSVQGVVGRFRWCLLLERQRGFFTWSAVLEWISNVLFMNRGFHFIPFQELWTTLGAMSSAGTPLPRGATPARSREGACTVTRKRRKKRFVTHFHTLLLRDGVRY